MKAQHPQPAQGGHAGHGHPKGAQPKDGVSGGSGGPVYTCPMHPEVRQPEPGDCPKCGMHLVPEDATKGHEPSGPVGHGALQPAPGGKYDTVPTGYAGPVYTCPMHPEVRQTGPGACPICGMGLQPETGAAADEGPNPELVDFTRRFWIATALTIPLLILTMTPYLGITALRDFFGERSAMWIEVVLATPVILWSGWPFFVRGWNSFRTMNLNMFSLIGMGVAAAYAFSMVAVILPGIFPAGFRNPETGAVGVYFEAAAVIVTLVLLGQVLELRAREGTGRAIRALLDMAPKTARVIRPGGSEEEVALEQVRPEPIALPVPVSPLRNPVQTSFWHQLWH